MQVMRTMSNTNSLGVLSDKMHVLEMHGDAGMFNIEIRSATYVSSIDLGISMESMWEVYAIHLHIHTHMFRVRGRIV